MTHHRKLAYNHLLYWAMLEIRPLGWMWCRPFKLRYLSPFHWRHCLRATRYCGALAEALHNLAYFASYDYAGFEEELFWSDIAGLERCQSGSAQRYREFFEQRLRQLESDPPSKT